MSWTDFFHSRYVRSLEERIAKHAEETAALKNTHAEELNRAIVEANRGWAEADRLRQYLFPGLPPSTRYPDTSEPTSIKEEITGTPWQREQQRIILLDKKRYQEEQAARKAKESVTASDGKVQ